MYWDTYLGKVSKRTTTPRMQSIVDSPDIHYIGYSINRSVKDI